MIEAPTQILLPGDVPLCMIKLQGGTFSFGQREDKAGLEVSLSEFHMGQFPITNLQYAAFLQSYQSDRIKEGIFAGQPLIYEHKWGLHKRNDSWLPAQGFEQHPIVNVTWYGANTFCTWLSNDTNATYSLPSETQWEYAARGGIHRQGFSYAGSYKLKEVGWYRLNSHSELKPVGLKKPNELGLYDMSGNVWEWCLDHWQDERNRIPQDSTPWLDAEQAANSYPRRVVRGGSWLNYDLNCRVSTRISYQANDWSYIIGFRVVRY